MPVEPKPSGWQTRATARVAPTRQWTGAEAQTLAARKTWLNCSTVTMDAAQERQRGFASDRRAARNATVMANGRRGRPCGVPCRSNRSRRGGKQGRPQGSPLRVSGPAAHEEAVAERDRVAPTRQWTGAEAQNPGRSKNLAQLLNCNDGCFSRTLVPTPIDRHTTETDDAHRVVRSIGVPNHVRQIPLAIPLAR